MSPCTALTASWTIGQTTLELLHDYEYDGSGRLAKVTADLHADAVGELEVTYGYDAANRLQSVSLQGGRSVSFHRDGGGRVRQMDFEASGQVRRRTLLGYSASSWLVDIETGTPSGQDALLDKEVLDLGYFYDLAGRIVRIEEGQAARVVQYDKASRLKGSADYSVYPGGAVGDQRAFSYDTLGNRTGRVKNGSTATLQWSQHGELQSVTEGGQTKTLTHDADGNLLSIAVQGGATELELAYDAAGRVTQVSDATQTQHYAYWPDERRARVQTDLGKDGIIDQTRLYFSDGLLTHVIDEATGQMQRSYVFLPDGFTPVMLVTYSNDVVANVYFYHNDHLSTPRALTDETGTVVWQARLAPFGEVLETCNPAPCAIDQPLRFPGQWDDGIAGVWYNWHRFYLPGLGVYARRDPIWRVDGEEFAYAGHGPVHGVDPGGLAWVYIWNKGKESNSKYGHAAIESEDGSQYLSFNPTFGKYKTKNDDIAEHNHKDPNYKFHVTGLSEESLKQWIRLTKATDLSLWSPWNNCVDAVAQMLWVSGQRAVISYLAEKSDGLISRPEHLVDALQKIGYENVMYDEESKDKSDCPD